MRLRTDGRSQLGKTTFWQTRVSEAPFLELGPPVVRQTGLRIGIFSSARSGARGSNDMLANPCLGNPCSKVGPLRSETNRLADQYLFPGPFGAEWVEQHFGKPLFRRPFCSKVGPPRSEANPFDDGPVSDGPLGTSWAKPHVGKSVYRRLLFEARSSSTPLRRKCADPTWDKRVLGKPA